MLSSPSFFAFPFTYTRPFDVQYLARQPLILAQCKVFDNRQTELATLYRRYL